MTKQIKIFFLTSFFVFLIVSCDSPKLDTLESNDVIVAFGDSLTVGVGVEKENSYPSKLAEMTGLKVVNAGVSGETTGEGLLRFPKVIKQHEPHLIILLEGGNDILRNIDYTETERNLNAMIQMAVDSNIQVVLVGVPEKKLFSNSADFYGDLAEKYDLVFEPSLIGKLMRDSSKKSDPIHFNASGYHEMAERLYKVLENNGAL